MKKLLVLMSFFLLAASAHGLPRGGYSAGGGGGTVIPTYDNVSANWTNAGLATIGGIPNRTTQCGATVTPSGITPPASGDDASKINAAIAACTAGQFVLLNGAFVVSQSEAPILVNKGISIRGSGSPTSACAGPSNSSSATPCWPTGITVRDGAISAWLVSTTQAGTTCGTSPTSLGSCTAANSVFLLSPSGNFNWGWAGCFLGTTPTGCGSALTADAAAGDTTIHVASTTNFSVGMWVLIDENPAVVSSANPTGGTAVSASPEWSSSSGSPQVERFEGGDLPSTFSFNANRLGAELHKISAIGAGTLTFDAPLAIGFRQSGGHSAQAYWPTIQGSTANPFLQQAGIENLYINRPANGAVTMMFCSLCWVKNVEVSNWIAGAVNIAYSSRSQVEGVFSHDCADCENNGVEYPVAIDSAATENLVTNSIIIRGGKGMVGRGSSTNVVAYNYIDDTFYMQSVIGDYWMDMSANGSHYAGTHHWLFEGNWGDNCDGDETHGSAAYHTFFRNDCTGNRTAFTDPSNGRVENDPAGIGWGSGGGATPPSQAPGPLRAAGPMAFNYWYAYAGNVLGLTGVTTTGNGWAYKCAFGGTGQTNKCIWMSGWVGSEWPAPDSRLTGATSPNWIFKNANYDYVSNSVDSTSGFTSTLPNSLYLASAPSFFGTGTTGCIYTWPWVTSQSATKLQAPSGPGSCSTFAGLPAKARWDAGTPFVQP